MKIVILLMILSSSLLGCSRSSDDQVKTATSHPGQTVNIKSPSQEPAIEHISMDDLVGTWLLLDSEGQLANSRGYISIIKTAGDYSGALVFQGSTKKIRLSFDGEYFLLISDMGEKYKLYRVRSRFASENNAIGVDLIVGDGLDDIELGSFQREDILKKLEGQ